MWSLLLHTNHYKKSFTFFFIQYKNERKEQNFWRQKDQKSNFYKNKKVTKIDNIDVNKMLVSKEEPYGTKKSFKYSLGYNDNDVIRPLCMKLHKWLATLSFKISDKEFLKKVQSNM